MGRILIKSIKADRGTVGKKHAESGEGVVPRENDYRVWRGSGRGLM